MYGNTAVTPQPKTKAHQELDDMFNWTFLSLVLVAYLHIIAGLSIKEANTTLLTIKMILEGFKTCGYVNLSILKRVESATLYCLVPMVVHFVNTPPKTSTNGFRVSLTKKEQKAYWQPLQITSVKMLNLALAVISGMAQCGTIFLTRRASATSRALKKKKLRVVDKSRSVDSYKDSTSVTGNFDQKNADFKRANGLRVAAGLQGYKGQKDTVSDYDKSDVTILPLWQSDVLTALVQKIDGVTLQLSRAAGRRSILGFLRRNGQRRMTEDEEHHQRIPIGLPSDAYAQDYINQLSMREHRELQISTEKHALTLHEALDQLNQLTMIS
ncbi:hypothetical protein PSTG_02341 [Puccinia striiformis f. sp. tritici PST-78]|uniref:Uncharacterized protein n=1 Tax=Puccinia striiformis f. sp. tritici PST-78 TaxID=1165861 RepID=A0A0L0VYS8_9BASI|nr:hypothetical protein PSTG_02341 [Puccinia striiformis f. sp. tritici PST-78]